MSVVHMTIFDLIALYLKRVFLEGCALVDSLRSCSSLCLRRGCTYKALKESVMRREGRLTLSSIHPLRWLGP